MYAATYRSKKKEIADKDKEVKLKRSLSLDSGDENIDNKSVESDKHDSANDYLQDTLGHVLGDVLADCALIRPDDPVAFVADAFER